MKKNLGVVPAVYPMPVLMVAAYDEAGTVNVMNAAWGMICAMDKIALFIDEDHKTTQNLLKTKAFTVSIADREHMDAADFFGIATGNKMADKFERTGYHAVKSDVVNAPVIDEFPYVMECELAEVIDTENMYAIVGRIVDTKAEESILDEKRDLIRRADHAPRGVRNVDLSVLVVSGDHQYGHRVDAGEGTQAFFHRDNLFSIYNDNYNKSRQQTSPNDIDRPGMLKGSVLEK